MDFNMINYAVKLSKFDQDTIDEIWTDKVKPSFKITRNVGRQ